MAKKKRFPKKELNLWLYKNMTWNHGQWLKLINELTKNGFEDWTSTEEGKDALGLFLETNTKF
jgi:hypothetical protein